MAPSRTLLVCAAMLLANGCALDATTQDWQYCLVNKMRAADSWKACYSREQRKCLSSDFEAGYKTGYFDTASGKDCRVPPVAPHKYWSASYQSSEGREAVEEWFQGYERGIVVAQADGYANFHDIPTSAHAPVLNKTACGLCFSTDPCECHTTGLLVEPGMQNAPAATYEAVPYQGMQPRVQHSSESMDLSVSQPIESAMPPQPRISDASMLPQGDEYFPQTPSRVVAMPASVNLENLQVVGGVGVDNLNLIGPVDDSVIRRASSTAVVP